MVRLRHQQWILYPWQTSFGGTDDLARFRRKESVFSRLQQDQRKYVEVIELGEYIYGGEVQT